MEARKKGEHREEWMTLQHTGAPGWFSHYSVIKYNLCYEKFLEISIYFFLKPSVYAISLLCTSKRSMV